MKRKRNMDNLKQLIQSFTFAIAKKHLVFNASDHREWYLIKFYYAEFLDNLKKLDVIDGYTCKCDSENNIPESLAYGLIKILLILEVDKSKITFDIQANNGNITNMSTVTEQLS